MDELTRNFATNVRALRLSNNISQAALAKRAAVSVSYISQLERGHRTPPLPTVTIFAKALKVRPLYLLQELDLPAPRVDLRFAIGRPPSAGRAPPSASTRGSHAAVPAQDRHMR